MEIWNGFHILFNFNSTLSQQLLIHTVDKEIWIILDVLVDLFAAGNILEHDNPTDHSKQIVKDQKVIKD